MKKLLQTFGLSSSLLLALLTPSVAAASDTWDVTMQGLPEETTSRNLRITYSVISKNDSDTFEVKLHQNGKVVATDSVTTPGGDSEVFEVTVPSSGTYTFAVSAYNNGVDATKNSQSETITVQEPVTAQPTVTTVYVPRSSAGSGTTGAGGRGSGSESGGQVLAQGTDTSAQEGSSTTDSQASDDEQQASATNVESGQEDGNQEETTVEAGDNDGVRIAILLALIAAAVGYGAYRYNPGARE